MQFYCSSALYYMYKKNLSAINPVFLIVFTILINSIQLYNDK
jgi:hypothetical protein